ncbi:MAG: DNA polymerase III subunit gamma/tau [Woeseia sp.]
MSYLVLARKWRPKNFLETAGQEHVLKALCNALDSQRLHHAYLFAGTRGVGKTTIARILAKALNCETGITSQPCGKCSACLEIDEGRFVDLIEVDAASKTKIDDTRDLLDNVPYAPARGRFKVYLIDEVHMLSRSSFNALLKTLEEPPPHVKFLLATTDPQKLPVTVLSRCLQFNLKRLTPKIIRERLELICEAEKIQAEPAALSMLARAADGSLRDALSLLDQAIAYCGGDLTEAAVGVMIGNIDRQHISELLALLAANDARGLVRAIARIDEQFPDYAHLLDDLARMLQRIAVFQMVGAIESEDDIDEDEIAEFAGRLSAEDLQLFYQMALIGRRDLHLAPDPKSGVEMTLLRMLAFQPRQNPATAGDASDRGAGAPLRRKPAPPAGKAPAEPAARPPAAASPQAWQDPDWCELVTGLGLNGAAKLLASNCAFLRREKNVVHLGLDRRSESLLTRSRQDAIAVALSRRFGEALKVDILVGTESGNETPVQQAARLVDERRAAARASLEADPNVKALKDMFGAELNPDSIELVDRRQAANRE